MVNLTTSVGNVQLESCLMNASGCHCTTKDELLILNDYPNKYVGAVVSKSSTLEKRIGNDMPRYYDNSFGTINSMGIPNYGYRYYTDIGSGSLNKPFIQSIIPFSLDDMQLMLYDINRSTSNYIVELNLSCPNLINKSVVGYDFESLDTYLSRLNDMRLENITLGLKLPPYYENRTFEQVANLITKYSNNTKFITCINSVVNGLLVDIYTGTTKIVPKDGYGGIGGEYCRPTALANVNQFYKLLDGKLDIIGCGGVSKGEHVMEHILCGASAVQIGSQLIREGPECFKRVGEELTTLMNKMDYKKIGDFKGRLKVVDIVEDCPIAKIY